MQENRWQQIEELFNRAAVLPVAERRKFIEDLCQDDEKLCCEISLLIESDSAENGFLNEPVFSLGAEILENDALDLLRKEDFADYKLKKLLGRGGMGAVFLAEDTRLGRAVAVKVLPSSIADNNESIKRFQREARAASGVAHQNIAHIYEFSQHNGRYFLAMEYVRGRTLREHIKEKLIDETRAVDFALQIAAALQAAHKSGIAHCDIKPENVIVTEDNLVKVLDFGLAKLTDASENFNRAESLDTIPGMIVGTTAYMSPEQVRGQHLDQRTDVWSLGVVLSEMLTGKRPFTGETPSDLQAAILRDTVPTLFSNIKLAKDFSALLVKCLEKDRLKRFQTASDFIAEAKTIQHKLIEDAPPQAWLAQDWILKAVLPFVLIVGAILGASNFTERFPFRQPTQNAATPAPVSQPIESLAVLPFENAAGDEQASFLSEGLAEDLTRSLGSLNLFSVVSYASARKLKGEKSLETVKNKLRVGSVLRGKIEKENGRLSVAVELLDLSDGKVLWAEKLSAATTDLLKIRDALTTVIADKFQTTPGREKQLILTDYGTRSNAAFQKYLEGKYAPDRTSEAGTRRAVESLKQAIELDPNYALAHVALADTENLLGTWFGVEPDFYQPLAKQTIERALAIDDNLSEAHTTLAKIKMDDDRDFAGAEKEFRRAIELNPNNALAHHWFGEVYLSAMGRLDESLNELEFARRLNPLSSSVLTALAWTRIGRREYERAVDLCDEAIVLDSEDAGIYSYKSMALMKLERYDEALAAIQKADELGDSGLTETGAIYGASGQTTQAREILQRLKTENASPYNLAVLHAALGEKDAAFELLEKQAALNSVDLLSMKIDPLLDALRDDARFSEIERKLNLPE
ncbi:MAG: protein kinase [Pyrinomonadaceae bacterium]|nr:protein kinase [Pyrinomonadaceae bacterium]